jgi:hypothetical protein
MEAAGQRTPLERLCRAPFAALRPGDELGIAGLRFGYRAAAIDGRVPAGEVDTSSVTCGRLTIHCGQND